jgi:hypothetical protein
MAASEPVPRWPAATVGCWPAEVPRWPAGAGRFGGWFRVRLLTTLLELTAGTSTSCTGHGTATSAHGGVDSVEAPLG